MKKGQLGTILLLMALVGGAVNLYRYYVIQGSKKPAFEVFDVRTFNDLEPMTIVHYQIRNVGDLTAHDVLTSVSTIGGNETPPAFFDNLSIGEAVSVNRKVPLGRYAKLRVGVLCRELRKAIYYAVEPDLEPDPPPNPDFIVYNLTLASVEEDNQTIAQATFWIMNIGGSAAHDVNVSVAEGPSTLVPLLPPGESKRLFMGPILITWGGLDIEIACKEGVKQIYHLIEYS